MSVTDLSGILNDLSSNIHTLKNEFNVEDISNQIQNFSNNIITLNTHIEGILELYSMVRDLSNVINTNGS